MAVINDQGLNDIGRQVISDPGFDPRDNQALRRAWEQWVALTSPVQRLAAEQAHCLEWLRGLHREHVQEQRGVPAGLPAADRPGVVPGQVIGGESRERGPLAAAVSELRHRSESPEWRPEPEAERRETPARAPWPPVPPAQPRHDPPPRSGPVSVSNLSDRAPVQQPSRKIAAYQGMFPELGRPVATVSGPKPLAECTVQDIAYRIADVQRHRQALHGENLTAEARIEDRERLNARDRVTVAERRQNIRDAQALQERLENAARALDEYGYEVLGELPEDELAECGFKRRVA